MRRPITSALFVFDWHEHVARGIFAEFNLAMIPIFSRWLSMCLCATLLVGCGLFDSGVEWRGGPYALMWIDDPNEVSLNYDRGGGSSSLRIESTVFAVGWDGRYLIAKQHPLGDRSITNFFVLDSSADSPSNNSKKVVIGPLTEAEFQQKSAELKLPPFSKQLDSLQ